jgi:hypothetical protein
MTAMTMTSKQKGDGSTGPGAISSQAVFGKAGNEHMKLTKLSLTFLTFTAAVPLISGMLLRGAAQTTPSDHNSSTGSDGFGAGQNSPCDVCRANRGREGGKDG